MIRWLHRYVFKGIGILFLAGMITLLYLAIHFQTERLSEPGSAEIQGGKP